MLAEKCTVCTLNKFSINAGLFIFLPFGVLILSIGSACPRALIVGFYRNSVRELDANSVCLPLP